MNTQTPTPIAIFKAGRFTAMNGAAFDFSESDLTASAAAYNPAVHEAPLVIGHPKDNLPAYGWVKSLNFADGFLQADPHNVVAEFTEWVKKGLYKKISASFYPPNHPSNPVPDVYYLRHVGFLGAQPPAVKGLPDPVFNEGEEGVVTIEFSETEEENVSGEDKTKEQIAADAAKLAKQQADFAEQQTSFQEKQNQLAAREAELTKKEQEARKRELSDFAETQIKAGKLLPKDKSGIVEFMSALNDATIVEFSEGDATKKVGALAWFQSYVANQPKVIEFSEVTGEDGKQANQGLTEQQLANKARVYHKAQTDLGNHISFSEAVDAVTAGEG